MTKHRIYIVLALGLLVIAAIWPWSRPQVRSSSPTVQQVQFQTPTPQSTETQQTTPLLPTRPSQGIVTQSTGEGQHAKQERERSFLNAFDTPINFWGRVVDENGNPVPNAMVKLGTADRPWETGSRFQRTTDANGVFSVAGAQGLSISVDVSKTGYYQTPRSRGQISYAQPSGNEEPLPTPDNPMVFELRKMGETVPLVQLTERAIRFPHNGSRVGVSLSTGQTIAPDQGELTVECWVNDQLKDARGQYIWRCLLSVPNGGLIERTDQYAFEAPADGYKPSVEIGPSPSP